MKFAILGVASLLLVGCSVPADGPTPQPSMQTLGGGYYVRTFWAEGPDGRRIPCIQSAQGSLSCDLECTVKQIAGAVLLVVLAGCSGSTGIDSIDNPRGKGDAPVTDTDGSGADVTNMPNGFSNIATKCLNGAPGFRVTVTSRGEGETSNPSVMVVTPDPACGDGGAR